MESPKLNYHLSIADPSWMKIEIGDKIEVIDDDMNFYIGIVSNKGCWGDYDGSWIEFEDKLHGILYFIRDFTKNPTEVYISTERTWLIK